MKKYVIRSIMGDGEWYWTKKGQGDRRSSMWTKGDLQAIRVYDTVQQAQDVIKHDIQNPVAVGILLLTEAQWERIQEARGRDSRHRGRFMMKEMTE